MSKKKQIEFERNEIAEIIAENFKPYDEKYDASDFEWSAHCLQMEGYHKRREDGKFIRLEDLQQFPIRKDHYDKKHGSEHFVFGVESVIEYAENLPTYDIAPSVDEILPASALFTLAQIEEKRQMLMLKHDAELTLNLLSDLKIEAHNKAVHPCGCKIDPYISLKVLDGIIQKYINKYYEEGKKNEN